MQIIVLEILKVQRGSSQLGPAQDPRGEPAARQGTVSRPTYGLQWKVSKSRTMSAGDITRLKLSYQEPQDDIAAVAVPK